MTAIIRRSFFDLTEQDLTDAEDLAFLHALKLRKKTGWDELLESRLILLLSEAQSGKTYECQQCKQRLWKADEAAFYIELSSAASQPWSELRSPKEDVRFERWQRTESETATIFLDSVDELRLTQGKFRVALRNVAKELAGNMARVRVILTSRPLPVDRELFLQTFAVPKTKKALGAEDFATLALGEKSEAKDEKKTAPDVRTVALAPLTHDDVAAIARDQKVGDIDAFFAGLRSSSMIDFITRPQDVIGAATAWNALDGRFGTHAEQVQFDIEARLRPNPKREDRPLTPARALEGAKKLALAAALSQRLTIQHDDPDSDDDRESPALDPALFLTDWDREDVRALLERALFGFASYGRVRFHNRFVIDFLAAARLSDLLDQGASERSIRRLLVVRTAQGNDVIRPSLHDVAAWLSRLRKWVFDLVKKLEPALLLNLGDPGSFPIEKRREALGAYIHHYGKGGWRGLHVPPIQIHRFADPGLGVTVKAHFAAVENVEVRQLLLELVAQAKLADCAALVRKVMWDKAVSGDERIDALQALIALGDRDLPRVAKALVARSQGWDNRFARFALVLMFPAHLSIDQFGRVLACLPETKSTGRELARTLPPLIERLETNAMREMRAVLVPLITEGLTFDIQLHQPKVTRRHLVPLLSALCIALIKAGKADADDATAIILVNQLGRSMRHDDEVPGDLRNATQTAGASLRPAIFDAEVTFLNALRPERNPFDSYVELLYRGTLQLTAADDGWLRPRVATVADDAAVRTAALVVEVLGLANMIDDRTAYLHGLKPLVTDSAEMTAYVDRYLKPYDHQRELRRSELCDRRAKRRRERQDARNRSSWIAFWKELVEDPDTAFSPDRVYGTAWDLWRVMDRTGTRNAGITWDRQFIEAHFGAEMADRLRAALIPIWRRETPKTSSEQTEEEGSSFYIRWNFALCAIAAEAENPEWASGLTDNDAEIATRYALLNMNGFPPWLDALAAAHPAIVDRVVGTELTHELERPSGPQSWSMTLQNISHATADIVAVFMGRLRDWLSATEGLPREIDDEAGAATRLDHVVEVMLKFGSEDDRTLLRDYANRALQAGSNLPFARVWLPVLFNLDPAAAVDRLEAMCTGVPFAAASSAVAWIAELFGHRHRGIGVNLKNPAMTGTLLLRLVRLAYVHVDRKADSYHEGSYTPDVRDEAQTGRGMLLNAILDLGGNDGWSVKIMLANSPEFAHIRDRVHALAMQRSAHDAEGPAMSPADIAALDRNGEPGPRTAGEMFEVMRDKLDELDDYLLRDDSPLDLWQTITAEKVLRREMSRIFDERAHGAFTVGQEGVTADEKETDIRFRSTARPLEGVLELKVGDKSGYSGASLKKVVREQLVAKYLAPETRRAGMLVISRAKRSRWKAPEGDSSLDFEALIEMLREEARAVRDAFPGELHIDVRGLDLKPRLTTERAAKANTRARKPSSNSGR